MARSNIKRKARSIIHGDPGRAIRALLEGEYDPVIMAELMQTPEAQAAIKKAGRPLTSYEQDLMKGSFVLFGTYERFIKMKEKEGKNAKSVSWGQ